MRLLSCSSLGVCCGISWVIGSSCEFGVRSIFLSSFLSFISFLTLVAIISGPGIEFGVLHQWEMCYYL